MVANVEYDELYKAVLRPGRKMETERTRDKYHQSLLCFDVHVKGMRLRRDKKKRDLSQQSGLKSLSQRTSMHKS